MPSLGGWEFVILIGLLVLIFGAKRLPDMARSIGQSARVFKGEMRGMKNDTPEAKADPQAPAATTAPTAQPVAEPAPLPPAQAAAPVVPVAPAVGEQPKPEASRTVGQSPSAGQ